MAKRRTFTADFKARLVIEPISGVKSSAEICREHHIKPPLLSRWKAEFLVDLRQQGLHLLAPYRSAKQEPFRFQKTLTHMRYRIETIIGQKVERFHIKKIWARDLWHLTSRWIRKLLSHTVAIYFCFQSGLIPLTLINLVQ